MSGKTIFACAVCFVIVGLLTSCGDKATDYQLTDLYQINLYLDNDPIGRAAFPLVWMDTTDRSASYPHGSTATGVINPEDYWVEIVSCKRSIAAACSSVADDFNGGDACGETQLSAITRAPARIATITEDLVCRYHIASATDSTIIVKDVHYTGVLYALMAKLNSDNVIYKGWSLYAIGRQKLAFAAGALDQVDSVVLVNSEGTHFRTYPTSSQIRYVPTTQLPAFSPGEEIGIEVYVRERSSTYRIADGYLNYKVGGRMRHEWMGQNYNGRFDYSVVEQSGGASGTLSQIVVELFGENSLRSDQVGAFNGLIWAITYKIGD
jgi:hypothetical protein